MSFASAIVPSWITSHLSDEWDSEVSLAIVTIVGLVVWQPIRYLINKWRIHRMHQKYPRRVLCKVSKATRQTFEKQEPDPSLLWRLLRSLVWVLSFVLTSTLLVTKGVFHGLRYIFQDLMSISTFSEKGKSPVSSNDIRAETVSIASEHSSVSSERSSNSKPNSALKAKSSPIAAAASSSQRVVFFEHSNGTVKTENYYYDPQDEPNVSMEPIVFKTPEKKSNSFASPEQQKRIQRVQTPPPRRANLQRPINIPDDQENLTNQQVSLLVHQNRATGSWQSGPNYLQGIKTQSAKDSILKGQLVALGPSFKNSTLSAQMRKRRLEGEDLEFVPSTKRQKRGRVALGGLGQRNDVVSTRTILSKRLREEREKRILQDMNRKRAKVEEKASNDAAKTNTGPAFQFGSSGSSTPTSIPSAPGAGSTSSSNDSKPSFSFGQSSTGSAQIASSSSGANTTSKPSGTSAPTFSFGGTPAPDAGKKNNESKPAFTFGGNSDGSSTGAPTSATPAPAFAFGGGAPAPAPSGPAPGFSFGGAAPASSAAAPKYGVPANPVTPSFGAAAPAATATAGGASARRRARSKRRGR